MWWCCGESAFRRHRTEYQGDGSAGFTGGLGLIWYRKWRGLFRWSQYRFGDPYLEIAFNPGLPTPTFVSLLKADSSQMRIPLQSISLEEMSQADVVKAKEAESVDCLLKSLPAGPRRFATDRGLPGQVAAARRDVPLANDSARRVGLRGDPWNCERIV